MLVTAVDPSCVTLSKAFMLAVGIERVVCLGPVLDPAAIEADAHVGERVLGVGDQGLHHAGHADAVFAGDGDRDVVIGAGEQRRAARVVHRARTQRLQAGGVDQAAAQDEAGRAGVDRGERRLSAVHLDLQRRPRALAEQGELCRLAVAGIHVHRLCLGPRRRTGQRQQQRAGRDGLARRASCQDCFRQTRLLLHPHARPTTRVWIALSAA